MLTQVPPAEVIEPTRRFPWKTVLALVVMFGIGLALGMVRTPYFVLEPGRTFQTESLVTVDGAEIFESPDGEVEFVTVNQRRASPIVWAISSLQESDVVIHEDELLRGRTVDEQREQNAQLMVSSQNAAVAAALNRLGFETAEPAGVVVIDQLVGGPLDDVIGRNDVIEAVNGQPTTTVDQFFEIVGALEVDSVATLTVRRPAVAGLDDIEVTVTDDTSGFIGIATSATTPDDGNGAAFDSVIAGGPADGVLLEGDRIVDIDGTPIALFEDLLGVLRSTRSGTTIDVTVDRGGAPAELEITLGARAFERVGLQSASTQFRDAELPVTVGFDTERIGGPSAGLAFTLTILDVLTEGDLTGGNQIVVTGTISRDGQVGPIGGVEQKAYAARDAGADVFLVPSANLEAAEGAVSDLRIEPVDTLDDALAILDELGGNVAELPSDGRL